MTNRMMMVPVLHSMYLLPVEGNNFQRVYSFPNGYGASVISHFGSYGGREGKLELAVFHNGDLYYDTPITGDVIGWLTEREAHSFLMDIRNLPPKSES